MIKKRKNTMSNLIILISLGFFAYFIYVAVGGSGFGGESKAWVLAKHEVENRLKSPDSAKFPPKSKATISETNGRYVINSYVDAENSFGASTRSKFTAIIRKDSSGKYLVESVDIK